ncbi:MAG: hypothetical protein AAB582_00205 [Patescibacteria group bacterium]
MTQDTASDTKEYPFTWQAVIAVIALLILVGVAALFMFGSPDMSR